MSQVIFLMYTTILVLITYYALKCNHKWNVILKIVSQPQPNVNIKAVSEEVINTIFCGKTTILLICDKCGSFKEKKYIGQPASILDESL